MSIRTIGFGILLASGIFIGSAANAQEQHPYCTQALKELQEARWVLLKHIDGKPMSHYEKEALRTINEMMREINAASPGSARKQNYQHAGSAGDDDAAFILQCVDLIRKAKEDLSHEDDKFADGLRNHSMKNCDDAIRFLKQDIRK